MTAPGAVPAESAGGLSVRLTGQETNDMLLSTDRGDDAALGALRRILAARLAARDAEHAAALARVRAEERAVVNAVETVLDERERMWIGATPFVAIADVRAAIGRTGKAADARLARETDS